MILAITQQQILQLTANGLVNGAEVGLLGVGFALMLAVVGRFNFAYQWVYAIGGYFALTFADPTRVGWSLWIGLLCGILLAVAVGVATEAFVYRPIAERAGPQQVIMTIFIASLGLVIVGENLIRLFWGSLPLNFFPAMQEAGFKVKPYRFGDVVLTNIKVFKSLSFIACLLALTAVLRFTPLGRSIKATRSNPDLAGVLGIDARRVHLWVFAIASAFAGLAGFWYGVEFSLEPTIGGKTLFFGAVAGFLVGPASSPIKVFAMGVMLSLVEQWSSLWIDSQRAQLVVFGILLVYLVVRSLELDRMLARVRATRMRSA